MVARQPSELRHWSEVKRSIVSCPTNSIGVKGAPGEFREAELSLPWHIDEDIYYCGYAAESSFGATSYFIQREEGNVLIDSPRFHPHLVKELERRGGVAYMILTHRDDVADHQKFRDHFQLKRVIHKDEVNSGTEHCEIIWDNEADFSPFKQMKLILVPGHTRGHLVALYNSRFLFTGDHMFVDQEQFELTASRGVCWYSWKEQIKSTEKLLDYQFEWVLPGHGGWAKFEGTSEQKLQDLIRRMRG